MVAGNKPRTIKSDERVFELIDILHESDGMELKEIDKRMDISKSSIHTHLSTLEQIGIVVKNDGQYQLSLLFFEYGMKIRNRVELYPEIREHIDVMAEETGELVGYFTDEIGYGFFVYAQRGDQAIKTDLSTGDKAYLHSCAGGKAILAHKPEHRVREIIDQHGLPQLTPNTITDPDALFEELEQIREDGVAYNRAESIEGINAVAGPIIVKDTVRGALSISAPEHRFNSSNMKRIYTDKIRDVVTQIELTFQFSDSMV